MPRSNPSAADQALIAKLAASGLHVTPTQLERWRHRGLIPRPRVTRLEFGGSRVSDHPRAVERACRLLAEYSTRGRPWQIVAVAIFEESIDITESALRAAVRFHQDRQRQQFLKTWQRAEAGRSQAGVNRSEWLADVAVDAARLSPRAVIRQAEADIRVAHEDWTEARVREATRTALPWRLADICAPSYMDDQQRTWARHGVDEMIDPFARVIVPLPSERQDCFRTITWAEADLARTGIFYDYDTARMPFGTLLDLVGWRVTIWRLDVDRAHPEQPLSETDLQPHIDNVVQAYEEWASRTELHGQDPLPGLI